MKVGGVCRRSWRRWILGVEGGRGVCCLSISHHNEKDPIRPRPPCSSHHARHQLDGPRPTGLVHRSLRFSQSNKLSEPHAPPLTFRIVTSVSSNESPLLTRTEYGLWRKCSITTPRPRQPNSFRPVDLSPTLGEWACVPFRQSFSRLVFLLSSDSIWS